MRTTADPKKLVRARQTGRRKLGMTDEEYRGLLSNGTGGRTTASKELSGEELARALAALRKAGFRTTADPQIRKIKSLWYEMHDLGIVRNRSDQAIETYIRRITRAQKIEWCSVEQLQIICSVCFDKRRNLFRIKLTVVSLCNTALQFFLCKIC